MYVRTNLSGNQITFSPAPLFSTFPGDTGWWQVSGDSWSVVNNDYLQMNNTDSGNNFLNIIYGLHQSSIEAVTFRILASASNISPPYNANDFGIQIILTDSGGLSGTHLGSVSAAFPAGSWPETQFSITVTPSAAAYYAYVYVFARYVTGEITIRQGELYQANGTTAINGYWQSDPIDIYRTANIPVSSGTLAPTVWGFYYQDLSNVDNLYSIDHSVDILSQFPYLVCNEPGVNVNSDTVVQLRMQSVQSFLTGSSTTKVFGYINVGVSETAYNGCIPPVSAVTAAVDRCSNAGYDGVFFDAAGQPGIPMDYMNYLVNYAHSKSQKLYVCANAHSQNILSKTVNTATLTAPTTAPSPTAAAGSTSLAAGTYTFSYTCVNYDGETTASNTANVTITSGQQINIAQITGFDANSQSLNLYMSIAAGSATLGKVLNWNGASTTITALPPNGAAQPPTTNTAHTANPNGIASTLGNNDWCLWESFYSRSDNQYAGVPEGDFVTVLNEYTAGVSLAHSLGVKVVAMAYSLSGTSSSNTSDQVSSYLLATMLGFDGWRYGDATASNNIRWISPHSSSVIVGNNLSGLLTQVSTTTWYQNTDQGTIWFTAVNGPASRSSGVFSTQTSFLVQMGSPTNTPTATVVTHSVEYSDDLYTWKSGSNLSTAVQANTISRFVRYVADMQN